MHPYLIKLGVHPDVQDFFAPYYSSNIHGYLTFDHGYDREIYGLGWHKIPSTENFWMAGIENLVLTGRVFICSSAMEAIAWLHYHHSMIGDHHRLCFIALGSRLSGSKLSSLRQRLAGKQLSLLFSSDLLGKIHDLKVAAALNGQPVSVTVEDNRIEVLFRTAAYAIGADQFSLNAFEKLAAFRFNVQTLKPKGALTWLDRLTAAAFNI